MTNAVILSAGQGKRLSPLTDSRPKCLVQIGGRPILEWQIRALADAGVEDIAVVTGFCGDAVEAMLHREGVSMVRRTAIPEGARDLPGTVLLLDTVGELSGAYAAADLAFVGGSLVPKGGHNVLEPSWHGVPTIVGPHMENFREIADAFLAGNALIRVAGEEELAVRLARFAADPLLFRETGLRAKELLDTFRGASEASTDAVVSALPDNGGRR